MVQFSLDCLTLTRTSPARVIESAGAAGFELVSLSLQPPPIYPELLVTAESESECAARLNDCGVSLHSVEFFNLSSQEDLDSYRSALEMGARLGGKTALAFNFSNDDPVQTAELLARFAEIADEFGLAAMLEPVAMGKTATLAQARDLIKASGADAGILFDSWHLMRTGGSLEDLRAIEPGLIRYVQLCDGLLANPPADPIAESTQERLYPGDGEFPMAEMARLLPKDVPWGIECPSLRRMAAGMSSKDQAHESMAAMRRLLAEATA